MPTSNPTSFDFLSSAVTLLDGLQYIGTAFKLVKNYHDSDQRRKHVIPWLVERAIQPMELSPLDRKFVLEQLRKPSFLDELHKARLPDHVRNAVDKVEVTKNTLENVAKSIENAMVQLWKSEGSPQEAVLIEASQRIEAEIKNFNEIVQEAFEKFQRPESPQELVRRAIPGLKSLGIEKITIEKGKIDYVEFNSSVQISLLISPENLVDQAAISKLCDGSLDRHVFRSGQGVTFVLPPVFDLLFNEGSSPDTITIHRVDRTTTTKKLLEFRFGSKRYSLEVEFEFNHDTRMGILRVVTRNPTLNISWSFHEMGLETTFSIGIDNHLLTSDYGDDLAVMRFIADLGVFQGTLEVFDPNLEQLVTSFIVIENSVEQSNLFRYVAFLTMLVDLNQHLAHSGFAQIPHPTHETQHEHVFREIPTILAAFKHGNRSTPLKPSMAAKEVKWSSLQPGRFPYPVVIDVIEILDNQPWLRLVYTLNDVEIRFVALGHSKASRIRNLETFCNRYPDGRVYFESNASTVEILRPDSKAE